MAGSARGRAVFFVETLSSSLKSENQLPVVPAGPEEPSPGSQSTAQLLRRSLQEAVAGLPACRLKRELEHNFEDYFTLFLKTAKDLERDSHNESTPGKPTPGKPTPRRSKLLKSRQKQSKRVLLSPLPKAEEYNLEPVTSSEADATVDASLAAISALKDRRKQVEKYRSLVVVCCHQDTAALATVLGHWGDATCSLDAVSEFDVLIESLRSVTLATGCVWSHDGTVGGIRPSVSDILWEWLKFFERVVCCLGDRLSLLSREKCDTLRELILRLLAALRLRQPSSNTKGQLTAGALDSLVTILSVYVSLCLQQCQQQQQQQQQQQPSVSHMVNILDLFFGSSPQQQVSVLHQVNASLLSVDAAKLNFVKLCRTVVSRVTSVSSFKEYLKIVTVCSAAQEVCKGAQSLHDSRSLQEVYSKIPQPSGFLKWLLDQDKGLVAMLGQSAGQTHSSSRVVPLEAVSAECREVMIQVCSRCVGPLEGRELVGGQPNTLAAAVVVGGPLFFLDTAGDSLPFVEDNSKMEVEEEEEEGESETVAGKDSFDLVLHSGSESD